MNAGLSTPRLAPVRREPTRRLVRAGEVDLWHAALDAQPQEMVQFAQTLITFEEAERARGFYFERDRRRFIVGRGILRVLLARYLGGTPRAIELRYNENEKPMLAPEEAGAPPLRFNLAHSEGLALYAFTRSGEIGIDVEKIRDVPEWEQIAASCLTPGEQRRLRETPARQRPLEFFRSWTRQEAILKALGVGLGGRAGAKTPTAAPAGRDDDTGPFQTGAGEALRALSPPMLSVHALSIEAGFVAAVAVEGEVRWASHFNWEPSLARPRARLRRVARERLVPILNHRSEFL